MPPSPSATPDPQPPAPDHTRSSVLTHSPARAFLYGIIQMMPFIIILIPFGVLFGVVALEAGIDMAQVLGFSVLVLAGASQFTAVQLISDDAPVWLILVSALTVNLRLAMYSASLVPWLRGANGQQRVWVAYTLVDQTYALAIQHYERYPRLGVRLRLAYFFGAATAACGSWVLASIIGALVGRSIPDTVALDFALPICFLAMIGPMLRTLAHVTACFVAVVMSLLLAGLPSGSGLLIAAPIGMAAGAMVETLTERRREGRA